MEPFFDVLLQTTPARSIVSHLDLDRHLIPNDTIFVEALGDTQPLARRTLVAFDGWQAGLRPNTDAANAHHGIAAAQHFLHPPETAPTLTALIRNDPGEIAQIEADHRLLPPVQDGANHVADFSMGDRLFILDPDNLKKGGVLVEVHARLEL